jgi:hypothetical protein
MSWTACYDDNCLTHLSEKEGSGWFPRKPKTRKREQGTENIPDSTGPLDWDPCTSEDELPTPDELEKSVANLLDQIKETETFWAEPGETEKEGEIHTDDSNESDDEETYQTGHVYIHRGGQKALMPNGGIIYCMLVKGIAILGSRLACAEEHADLIQNTRNNWVDATKYMMTPRVKEDAAPAGSVERWRL